MKLPDLYGDWRIVAGVVLLMLGIGNWVVGLSGTNQYRKRLAQLNDAPVTDLYRSFDELDPRTDGAVLAPLIQQQRNVSYVDAQMDFYHTVYLTGRMLFAAGLVVTLLAFIAAIRRDTRRALARRTASYHGRASETAHAGQD